jgi:hypothetical protein
MFYKAKAEETGNMWDTWLYMYDGTYYLLAARTTGRIGVVRSGNSYDLGQLQAWQ